MLLFLISLFVVCAEAQSSGLKLHVSVSGNDSNPGTKEYPLASLKGAVNRAQVLSKDQKSDGPV